MQKVPFVLTVSAIILLLPFPIKTNALEVDQTSASDLTAEDLAAKRDILEKTRDYLKSNPISGDLRSFIDKRQTTRRLKRAGDGVDNNSLYVIQDGNVIPLKNLKKIYHDKRSSDHDGKSFTVVPLIIPIVPRVNRDFTVTSKSPPIDHRNAGFMKLLEESNSLVEPDFSGLESPVPHIAIPRDNVDVDQEHESDEDVRVLHKILDDVEDLMQWKNEGTQQGVLCNINGSWVTEAGGMRLDICSKSDSGNKFAAYLEEREPPTEGFMCDGNWTLVGAMPFNHSGVVVVLATHVKNKHIATFIGECRVCDGVESVAGTWLIGRSSKNCKDQKASHQILSDVWQRENVHALQKQHLAELKKRLST